tara:strand:- start:389 stop:784 length:396 start_codon:yes stop_codon:yes gene_type:complete
MNYKYLMGYGNEKKKKSKSKQNKIVENIKSELNEWNDDTFKTLPKRWTGAYDKGLTEYEKERMNEGPAFEYKKHAKNIDKSLKGLQKSYLDLYDSLRKKGLNDAAADFLDNYKKNVVGFTKKYKKDFGKLM